MFKFVLNKMRSKKWMVISLLIGNILLISIACVNPMYTHAVLQRMLTTNLSNYMQQTNRYPGMVSFTGSLSVREGVATNQDLFDFAKENYQNIGEDFGVPVIRSIEHYNFSNYQASYDVIRNEKKKTSSIQLGSLSDIEEHAEIIEGKMFSDTLGENNEIEVIVSQTGMVSMDLLIGEKLTLSNLVDANGTPYRIHVVGVFKNSSPDDIYWVRIPTAYNSEVFMSKKLFDELFINGTPQYPVNATWYGLLDYEQMRCDNAQYMYDLIGEKRELLETAYAFRMTVNFENTLGEYLVKAKQVQTTLLVLQVPILVLLCAFIFMVSRQMLEMEQNEISILKSRGASRSQILTVYFIQSLIITIISCVAALPLSGWLCQVLGSANAFLEFVRRKSLTVEYSMEVLMYGAAAAVFSILVMVLPVIKYSSVSIVDHKRRRSRRSDKPMWQKLFLDVILLGVSVYGLYSFNNQKEILAQRVMEGASLDPLLFLSSSLFIIGAGLLAVRVIPYLIWLVFTIFKRLWSPGQYAAFTRVLRTKYSHGFIMVFLMMTIALGIFNAQTARTINTNCEELVKYTTGADLVMRERWESTEQGEDSDKPAEFIEPDYGKYLNIDGVESVTKVYRATDAAVSGNGLNVKNVQVLGLHTREFGETAWFKTSLLQHHWYEYLNAIAQNSRAVLLSSNFRDKQKLKIGDVISYKIGNNGKSIRGIVYGFIDYWPAYSPVTNEKGNDGLVKETDNYLIVANLSQIQATDGVKPYEIWMKMTDSTRVMYDYIAETGIDVSKFEDTSALVVEKKNDPMFQGTNGILTVGFIVVLLLCATGFLIYWILSIRSRSLQFGIYRAMGMSLREILGMLINEQICISGLSIVAGTGIGLVAAKLFIPLIQIAYSATDNVLPLEIITDTQDFQKLFGVVGGMILICMIILAVIISKIKIAQALKLGED